MRARSDDPNPTVENLAYDVIHSDDCLRSCLGDVKMGGHSTRLVTAVDIPAAIDVLARGFDREPAKLALLADPRRRRMITEMSACVRLYDGIRRGAAHAALVDDAIAAVAIWIPPGVPELSLRAGLHAVRPVLANINTIAPAFASAVRRDPRGFIRLVRAHQRAVARASAGDTWSLAMLATVPEHRGKGLARSLLERQLSRCDEDGLTAWLETTDPVNVPIYERFGFETVAELHDVRWLPGIWIMRRYPKLAREHAQHDSSVRQ